jgi:hypothetical protein
MKKSAIAILSILLLNCVLLLWIPYSNGSPSSNVSNAAEDSENVFTEQFRLDKNTGRYYVSALNGSQTWNLNLTSVYHGIFYLLIFENRPEEDYFLENGSLNPIVFSIAIAYNNTPIIINSTIEGNEYNYFLNLSYTVSVTKLYYLMVYLDGGTTPDTFILKSSTKIQAYFIPFIDGFPIELLLGCIGLGFLLIKRKIRMKLLN